MMSKYQTYPEYKKSGNQWINVLPIDWKVVPLKYLTTGFVKDGPHETPKFIDEGIPFLSVDGIQNNQLVFNGCRYISLEDHQRYSLKCRPKNGDILLGKAASVGKVALVNTDREFNVWSPLAVISPKKTCFSKFIYYALQSTMLQAQCEVYSNSNTQKNLGMSTIDNLDFVFPSESEAINITLFLDHETAKIDTLIEKQQKLIELLKEKRQAVISHAVTKGLNPDAPMKDSGVEWLGEVPAHWVVLRLSRVGKVGQGCSFSHSIQGQTKGDIPWYKVMDMNTEGNEEYMNESSNYINKKLASQIGAPTFPKGSIIFPRVGAALLTNKRRILSVESIVDDNLYTFVSEKVKHRFAYRFLQLINMETLCSPGLVPTITFSAINNIYIPLPSLTEQDNIIEYVDSKLSHIDLLIDKTNNAIKLSQERRTALISAAVTGKIDVRNWVAPTTSSDTNEAQQEVTA
ncbi:restriction endonuclease subunit S [Photobacterium leiognathi]|uniref:restriction endonuclease subunit S n=1 Tax=Photobacterium leiognathi TaxID=553611 RepID=UPI00273838E3|nr:restriction endonuclease subunit S [Photobacterium leiognathi]